MSHQRIIDSALLLPEITFTTSRSGGPGGQNVNKVNSKVTLRFDVDHSQVLNDEEKQIIRQKLHSIISNEGVLIISSQEGRSQLDNKETVTKKFDAALKKAFTKKKARKATKPSKSSKRENAEKKKANSEKKKWRGKIDY